MDNEQLKRAIDACRPNSEDLNLPELADLAARLDRDPRARELFATAQRLDENICAAMEDVLVPEGLAQRMLAGLRGNPTNSVTALENTALTNTALINTVPIPDQPGVELSTPPIDHHARRRITLAVAGMAVLTASIAMIVFHLNTNDDSSAPRGDLTAERLLDDLIVLYQEEDDDRFGGRSLADFPSDLPPHDFVRDDLVKGHLGSFDSATWRKIQKSPFDSPVVAYDLRRGDAQGTLYVMRIDLEGLPDSPRTARPQPGTHNYSAAAWRTGELVYVLVVEGSESQYDRLLNLPPPILSWWEDGVFTVKTFAA